MSAIARTLLVAALFGASITGAAYARDQVFTARLAAAPSEARLIVQNAIWNCEGETCVASVNHDATVRACRQFAREAGAPVLAYGSEARQLSSDDLARCNGDLAQSTQQARN